MPNLTQGLLAGIQSGPVQLGNAHLPFNMAPYVNSQTQADSLIDQLQAYEDSIEAGEDNMRKLRKMLDPADLSHKVASIGTSSLSQYMFYNSLVKQADFLSDAEEFFNEPIRPSNVSPKQAAPNPTEAVAVAPQPEEPIMSVLPEEPTMSVEPVSSASSLDAPVVKSQAKTPVKNLPPPPLPVATEPEIKRFQLSGQATREQLRNAVLRELNLKARQGKFTAGSTVYPVDSAEKIQTELSRRDAERAGMKQQIGYLRQELGAIDPVATKSMTDYDLEHMIQESRGNVDVGWNEVEGRPAGQVGGYSDQSPILSRFRNILNIPNRMFGKSETRMEDLQRGQVVDLQIGQGNQKKTNTRQAPTPGVYTDSEAELRSKLDFGENFQPYDPNIEIVDYGGGIPSLEESKDILVGTRNRIMRNLLRYPGRFIGAGIDRGLDAYDELRLSPEEMAQIKNPTMLQQARSYLGMPVALDRFRTGLKGDLSASLGGPGYTYRDILDLDNGPYVDNEELARARATAMGQSLFGESITPEDAYYYFGDAANALYAPSATSPTRPARPLQLARAQLGSTYSTPKLINTPPRYYREPAKPAAQPTAQPAAQPTAQATAQGAAPPAAQPAAQPTAQPAAQPTAQTARQQPPGPNPDFRQLVNNRNYTAKLNPEANQIAQDYIAEFDEDVVLQERYIRLLANDLEDLKSEYPDEAPKPKSVADEIAGIEAALTYMTNIVEAGDLEERFRDVENTAVGPSGYRSQADRDKAYNEALKAKNENYNRYIGARYNRSPGDVGTFMDSEYIKRNPATTNNQQHQAPSTK